MKLKSVFRRPFFLLLFAVFRPIGKVPVRIGGSIAWFKFGSRDELARVWGFAGEKVVFASFLSHVHPGDRVWDVGANVGTHTVMFGKKVGDSGSVFAFEPEPRTRSRLEANVELNSLANVTTMPIALGDEKSVQTMFVDQQSGSGKHSLNMIDGFSEITVEVQVGDELADTDAAETPTVIKIDVEGFELKVLNGIRSILADGACRLVLCEVHTAILQENGSDPGVVRELLIESGFTTFEQVPRGNELHLTAFKSGNRTPVPLVES